MKLLKELAQKTDLDDYVDNLLDEFTAGKMSYNEAFNTIKKLAKQNPQHDFDFWVIMLDAEADNLRNLPGGGKLDKDGYAIRHKVN